MANILSAILLLVRNLPTIITISREVLALIKDHKNSRPMTASDIKQMEKDILDGIQRALHEQDQRHLEKILGSPRAGKPSGLDFTERRSTLPGLVQGSAEEKRD